MRLLFGDPEEELQEDRSQRHLGRQVIGGLDHIALAVSGLDGAVCALSRRLPAASPTGSAAMAARATPGSASQHGSGRHLAPRRRGLGDTIRKHLAEHGRASGLSPSTVYNVEAAPEADRPRADMRLGRPAPSARPMTTGASATGPRRLQPGRWRHRWPSTSCWPTSAPQRRVPWAALAGHR